MLALIIESWIWYGVAASVTLLRFISHIVTFGHPKHLLTDDYLMMVALGFYTTEIVTMNIVANVSSNLFPDGWLQTHHLSQKDISDRIYGSKMILVVEQCQIATIWLIKTCLLIMYYRITVNSFRKHNIAVKVLMGYVAFTFVFMEIFYFGVWCRPFSDYYAVPTPNIQCSAATNHLITNAVFNLTSDIAMLCIALPMFIRSNLPFKRKLILSGVFSLGFFVIIAAVLNKYYSFTQPFGSLWTYWYIRESSTAMIVANLPFLWTLLRKVFGAASFNGASRTKDDRYNEYTERKGSSAHVHTTSRSSKAKLALKSVGGRRSSKAVSMSRSNTHADVTRSVDIEKGTGGSSSADGSGGGVESHNAIMGKEDALIFGMLDDEDFEDPLPDEHGNSNLPKGGSAARKGSMPLFGGPGRRRSSVDRRDSQAAAGAQEEELPPLPEFGIGVDAHGDPATDTGTDMNEPISPRPIMDKAVLSPSRKDTDHYSDEPPSPMS